MKARIKIGAIILYMLIPVALMAITSEFFEKMAIVTTEAIIVEMGIIYLKTPGV